VFGDVISFLFLVFVYKDVNDEENGKIKMDKTEIRMEKLDRFVKLGK